MLNNKLNSLIRRGLYQWTRSISFFLICFCLSSCGSEADDPDDENEDNSVVELSIDGGDTDVDGGDSYLVDEELRLLSPGSNVIRIGDAYKQCEQDADCVLVGPSCYSCCTLTAINRDLMEIYERQIEEICADYFPPSPCTCTMPDSGARCQDHTCTEVPRETSSD